jgi:putative SOS response-associated peptidase YedK
MCLDIAFYSALELIDDYFPGLVHDQQIDFDTAMGAHVMAMEYKRYPIVIFENGSYHLKYFEWGIIADYMDTPQKIKAMRPTMANFRTEKVLDDKKSFWHRIRHQRCLIPLMGMYEHREIKGWKNKVPYYITINGRKLFCVPGLYYYNEKIPSDLETGEMRGMFSMGTRQGNETMRLIHNSGENPFRMPLFVPKDLELKWLYPNLTDEGMRTILEYELPSEELRYHTVASIRGKTPRADGKCKYEPFGFANLPPLGNDDGTLQTALF